MAIGQKDIKMLWARSGGLCNICKQQLIEYKRNKSKYVVGEQAHIVAEKNDGPRGNSCLSQSDRNSYSNLILLCPTCHTRIDNNIEDFSIERLHRLKEEHELSIQEKLTESDSSNDIQDYIYMNLINSAVDLCCLEYWNSWISSIACIPHALDKSIHDGINEFGRKISSAIFPNKYQGLENSLKTFSKVLDDLINVYHMYSKNDGDRFIQDSPETYILYEDGEPELMANYKEWKKEVDRLSFDTCRAANWFGDEVRMNVNPMFFLENGIFTITIGPCEGFSYYTYGPQYTDEEKNSLPESYENSKFKKYIKCI